MAPESSCDLVSIPVSLVDRNRAGTLFGNATFRVVILRWENFLIASDVSEFVEAAFVEMSALGGDTLMWDLRRFADMHRHPENLRALSCVLADSRVRRVGIIVCSDAAISELSTLGIPAGQAGPEGKTLSVGTLFDEVACKLDALAPETQSPRMSDVKPPAFLSTYGGTKHHIPEANAIYVAGAGNFGEPSLTALLYQQAIADGRRLKASAFIIDTSAIARIMDKTRYLFAYHSVFVPLAEAKIFKTVIHVRSGEALMSDDMPDIGMFMNSFFAFHEMPDLASALTLLRVVRGQR